MLFHDPAFLFLFLPATLLAYAAVPARARNGVLLIASLVFYGASSLTFLPLLLLSTLIDFVAGLRIEAAGGDARARRAWLLASLASNLGLLATFKYAGWLSATLRGLGWDAPLVEVPLPIGISFYTFQTMSYTLGVYRGDGPAARSLLDFTAYVTLFPQLVAGPIVRHEELARQLADRRHDEATFAAGVQLFVLGLAKKVLLADTAAWLAAPLLALDAPSTAEAWAATLLFAAQIYYDFSGYSDMAIGLGRLFGLELPRNFDSPYKATSFSDFWSRWHMTLSRWLRDNLYIPLGGNRRGPGRTYVNLAVTMLLGGLWHGAAWTFVAWGAWHGALLAVERLLRDRLPGLDPPTALRRAAVFGGVCLGWVFFHRATLDASLTWLGAMLLPRGGPVPALAWAGAGLLLLPAFTLPNTGERAPRLDALGGAATAGLLALAVVLGLGQGTSPFLYYRF